MKNCRKTDKNCGKVAARCETDRMRQLFVTYDFQNRDFVRMQMRPWASFLRRVYKNASGKKRDKRKRKELEWTVLSN